jgi:3-methyl-2-oxobutanoate hydroxymethyltransferase
VELVDPAVTQRISEAIRIPTIGIGSGEACDGQVLVTHDLVGAFPWFHPKFVTPAAHVGETIKEAVKLWLQQFE